MSEGMNKVILIGNLGEAPEIRHTQGGTGVLNLRMACTETYFDKDKQKQERTEWVNVVVWGPRAEGLAKCDLDKGTRVCVEGRLSTSSYDDKEGVKRYKTEVVAENVLLLGGGPKRDDDRREERRDDRRDDRRDTRSNGSGSNRRSPF